MLIMNYLGVTFASVAFSRNYELILLIRFQGSVEWERVQTP